MENFDIFNLRFSIYDFFFVKVLIPRLRSGRRLRLSAVWIYSLVEKTKPICAGFNCRKVLWERKLSKISCFEGGEKSKPNKANFCLPPALLGT
jgi:hypothetical protein